jgi:hypothetical protein
MMLKIVVLAKLCRDHPVLPAPRDPRPISPLEHSPHLAPSRTWDSGLGMVETRLPLVKPQVTKADDEPHAAIKPHGLRSGSVLRVRDSSGGDRVLRDMVVDGART